MIESQGFNSEDIFPANPPPPLPVDKESNGDPIDQRSSSGTRELEDGQAVINKTSSTGVETRETCSGSHRRLSSSLEHLLIPGIDDNDEQEEEEEEEGGDDDEQEEIGKRRKRREEEEAPIKKKKKFREFDEEEDFLYGQGAGGGDHLLHQILDDDDDDQLPPLPPTCLLESKEKNSLENFEIPF